MRGAGRKAKEGDPRGGLDGQVRSGSEGSIGIIEQHRAPLFKEYKCYESKSSLPCTRAMDRRKQTLRCQVFWGNFRESSMAFSPRLQYESCGQAMCGQALRDAPQSPSYS